MDELVMPIVISKKDVAEFQITWFVAKMVGQKVIIEEKLIEIEESATSIPAQFPTYKMQNSETIVFTEQWDILKNRYETSMGRPWFNLGQTFDRVQEAYDLEQLAKSRLVIVGVGGAAEWIEEMARAGVGEIVLIDPDIVSESNLATQHTYRKDIDRPKVDCIAERIRDINPNIVVKTFQKKVELLNDNQMQVLLTEPFQDEYRICPSTQKVQHRPMFPRVTLLCGFTDSFQAQARVNRLALQYGVPSICAQLYTKGLAAEITFTHPDFTEACHRCILTSRYNAYLKEGFENDVTSHGTPIFSTTRVNAIKGFIAMALLHTQSNHLRWSNLLKRISSKNLVQIRMAPNDLKDFQLPVFDRVFEGAQQNKMVCDEAVWLPQKPNHPDYGQQSCPDCGGSGDLRTVQGTITNTCDKYHF